MKPITMIKPDYYSDFACKGTACRRTCCNGWNITLSKKEYQELQKWKRGTGLLERIPEDSRSASRYARFILKENGCPLQTPEGLCGLQKEFGEAALSRTCAVFPRKGIQCGDFAQMSLSLACERTVELILRQDTPIRFIRQEEADPTHIIAGALPKKDGSSIYGYYLDLYQLAILLLQAEDVPLEDRLILLGLAYQKIKQFAEKEQFYRIPGYIETFLTTLEQTDDIERLIPKAEPNLAIIMNNLLLSETLIARRDPHYKALIDTIKRELDIRFQEVEGAEQPILALDAEAYRIRSAKLNTFLAEYPLFLENLMVSLFTVQSFPLSPGLDGSIWDCYTYHCWIYSNLKIVLTACIETFETEEDLVDACTTVFRPWIHNSGWSKFIADHYRATNSDTLAHMVLLLKSC